MDKWLRSVAPLLKHHPFLSTASITLLLSRTTPKLTSQSPSLLNSLPQLQVAPRDITHYAAVAAFHCSLFTTIPPGTVPLTARGGKFVKDATACGAGLLGVAVKDVEQAFPDGTGLLGGIDGLPDASLAVVVDDGGSLGVVGCEALLERIGVVVGALDQRLASHVVSHGLLGRVEGGMVRAARGRVHKAASNAGDKQGVVDLQLDSMLELLVARLQHGVEGLGLWHGPGEAIEDESMGWDAVLVFIKDAGFVYQVPEGIRLLTLPCTRRWCPALP